MNRTIDELVHKWAHTEMSDCNWRVIPEEKMLELACENDQLEHIRDNYCLTEFHFVSSLKTF